MRGRVLSRRKSRRVHALAEVAPMPERKTAKVEPRIGFDGQSQSLGHWDQEYNPDLKDFENRIARFEEITTGDASVVGAIEKLWYPVARATYTIDAQGPDERSETAAELMRANLLREGAPAHNVYRMATKWSQFLWETFSAEHFGPSVHEIVTRVQPGKLGTFRIVHKLAWIHPSSIYQFRVDRDGDLLGIVQRFQARWWENGQEKSDYFEGFIEAKDLFVHVRKQRGSNFEGQAMVRGMYSDAKRNQAFRNWQAVHAQRVAVGIPRVKLAPEAPPEIQERAIDMAKSMRGGAQDKLYVVETPGVSVGWVENTSQALDISGMLRSGEDRVRGVASLEWAGLGQSGAGGSRAVGDTQQRPFWLQAEGTAEAIVEDVQNDLIERLHRSNFGEEVPPPTLRVSNVAPVNVAEIAAAASSGLVIIKAEDSSDIRASLGLRRLRKDEMEEHESLLRAHVQPGAQPAAAVTQPTKPAAPVEPESPKPKSEPAPEAGAKPDAEAPDDGKEISAEMGERVELAARTRRHPSATSDHESAHCKLDDLAKCYDDTARDAAHALRPLREQAIREALGRTVIKGTRVTVPVPKSARKAMMDALRQIAESARETGRETARHEIRSQVAALSPAPVDPPAMAERFLAVFGLASKPLKPFDPFAVAASPTRTLTGAKAVAEAITDELETVLSLNVDEILDQMIGGLKREIVQGLAQEMGDEEAKAYAQRVLFDRSESSLEKAGREMASRGINGGRAEVVEQANDAMADSGLEVETATRTSVLEESTCGNCRDLHGRTVDLDSPEYFEIMPPAECDGGAWCRCVMTYNVTTRPNE